MMYHPSIGIMPRHWPSIGDYLEFKITNKSLLPGSSSSPLDIEISGVLSSSLRTVLSKLTPDHSALMPDLFFKLWRYSSSSLALVSSSMMLVFLEELKEIEVWDKDLAFWNDSFHFAFLEDMFTYENKQLLSNRHSVPKQIIGRYRSIHFRDDSWRNRKPKVSSEIISGRKSGYQAKNNRWKVQPKSYFILKLLSGRSLLKRVLSKAMDNLWESDFRIFCNWLVGHLFREVPAFVVSRNHTIGFKFDVNIVEIFTEAVQEWRHNHHHLLKCFVWSSSAQILKICAKKSCKEMTLHLEDWLSNGLCSCMNISQRASWHG